VVSVGVNGRSAAHLRQQHHDAAAAQGRKAARAPSAAARDNGLVTGEVLDINGGMRCDQCGCGREEEEQRHENGILGRQEGDWLITRHRVSPFHATDLDTCLRANGFGRFCQVSASDAFDFAS
jgi:hypothetical protein